MKKRAPRVLRLRARPRKIRKNRRSKKLLRKPAIIPLITVTLKIINKYLFNIFHKYLRKNHKNIELVVQKKAVKTYYVSAIKRQNQTVQQFDSPLEKTSKNHITRILREAVKTVKMLDCLDNNLLFSLSSILYSQSFILITVALSKRDLDNPVLSLYKNQPFVFISQLKPYHFFRGFALRPSTRGPLFFNQKVIELVKITSILSELPMLLTLAPFSRGDDVPFAFKEYYDGPSSDNQQSETEDGTPKQGSATQEQEDESHSRHTRQSSSPFSPEELQAFDEIVMNYRQKMIEDNLHYRHIMELPTPFSPKERQVFQDRLFEDDYLPEKRQVFQDGLFGNSHQIVKNYYDLEVLYTKAFNPFPRLSVMGTVANRI